MPKKTNLKVIKSKNISFIDDLIIAVQHSAEKQCKRLAKEYYKAASKLKEGLDELD